MKNNKEIHLNRQEIVDHQELTNSKGPARAGRRQWSASLLLICLFFLTGTALAKSGKTGKVSLKSQKKATVSAKNKRSAKNKKKRGGNLFDRLTGIAVQLGIPADSIEIVRYAVKRPDHFVTVAGHAAAQDYPFFALIGAAKIARRTTGFTQKQCEMPMTVIDEVFGKADSTIDNGKGRQDTTAVVGVAKEYAAKYAKEQTAAAKQEIFASLTQQIPYFGELPAICSFAFETNLQIERNIQDLINDKVKKVRGIYYELSDGNYTSAVAHLIELGADASIACDFIDSSVGAGLIGRTPVLGSLAKGACKSFTGEIFKAGTGLIKDGYGYLEVGVDAVIDTGKDIGCAVYSLLGNGCSSAPPPDPVSEAINAAKSWCSTKGGLEAFILRTVDNMSYRCNDGYSQCSQRPGEAMRCETMTPAERAAFVEQRTKLLQADIDNKLPADALAISQRWGVRCPLEDRRCRIAVGNVVDKAVEKIKAAAAANFMSLYPTIKFFPFYYAEMEAQSVVHDKEFLLLPQKWAADFTENYLPECKGSQKCIDAINFTKGFILLGVSSAHKNNPAAPHSAMSPIYANGEQAAIDYFKTHFQADKKNDDEQRKQLIVTAVMNAVGREPNVFELLGYGILIKNGKNAEFVYQDAVIQMNKYPKERRAMISRAYLALLGKDATLREFDYWLPRQESYKELIAAAREYLYSQGGKDDLDAAILLALHKKYPGERLSSRVIYEFTRECLVSKKIYNEM